MKPHRLLRRACEPNMQAIRRRRWVVMAGVVATLPVCLTAAGAAPAAASRAPQVTPIVDADYLYGQLYEMSKAFSYRISGADGDPRNAADAFNLPPTVNGWQELIAYWK